MSLAFATETEQMPHERRRRRLPGRQTTAGLVGVMLVALGLGWLLHPALVLLALGAAFVWYSITEPDEGRPA